MACVKFVSFILLYNTLSGIIALIGLFRCDSGTIGGIMTSQWTLLPAVQSASSVCPCRHCGRDTLCYRLNHTIVPFGLPTHGVQKLRLYENMITAIYGNDFRGMGELQLLALDNNNISFVDRNAFAGLHSLESLHLEHNQLRHILPGTFTGLTRLQNIFLNNNQLTSYPGDLPYMTSLRKINVDFNQISRVPWTSFIRQSALRRLSLWSNPVTCDCNTRMLMRWLNGTASGRAVQVIGSPLGGCTENTTTPCPPVAIRGIEHVAGTSGVYVINSTALLHCDVTQDLMPYWLTPRSGYVYPYQRDRITAYINGTLEIRQLRRADNGSYRCYASYVRREERAVGGIGLEVIEASAPRVVPPSSGVEATTGARVLLTCRVSGVPPPVITWQAPGNQSDYSVEERMTSDIMTSQVTIPAAKEGDGGRWECWARNVRGNVVGVRTLTVLPHSDVTMVVIIASVAGGVFVVIVVVVTAIVCLVRKRRKKTRGAKEEEEEEEERGEKKKQKREEEEAGEPPNHEPFIPDLLPGSQELQQPFEFEPEVKGFRL